MDLPLCHRFQQVATEYEQIKSAGIDPQVAELAEYHSLGTARNVAQCFHPGMLRYI